jgi:hypothetical protein
MTQERMVQARRLSAAYEEANGHPPPTTETLMYWAAGQPEFAEDLWLEPLVDWSRVPEELGGSRRPGDVDEEYDR